nr:putative CYP719 [synthetic construct]
MGEGSLWIVATTLVMVGVLIFMMEQSLLWRRRSTQKWPPGPTKFPFIGNLYQLNKGGELVHVTLTKMAQQYGRIMTIWFGSQEPTIVVSDHELAWEVLVTKSSDYSSRTLPYLSRVTSADFHTLATCDLGPYWQTLRKGLQAFTINPHNISSQIHLQEKDIADLVLSLEEEASLNNGVVDPLPKLRRLLILLIRRFCFGPDREFNDDLFVERMDCALEDVIRLFGHARLIDVFEFARYIPGIGLGPFQEVKRLKQRIKELIRPYILAHKSSNSACQNCHLNFLLSQGFTEDVVILNLFELFMLGVDSTSAAIAWALAFVIHEEETQQKLVDEVINKLGRGRRMVGVEEVSELEYVQAVVKETMRMKPIAPLPVPHRAVRDSELKGTKVREGTQVLVNLYAVLTDGRVWKEPNRFMPKRFLQSQRGEDMRAMIMGMERSFIPFGAGRRICAGMELAKPQVALTLANLVYKFQWCSEVEGQLPDLSEDLTFVLRMKTPLVA